MTWAINAVKSWRHHKSLITQGFNYFVPRDKSEDRQESELSEARPKVIRFRGVLKWKHIWNFMSIRSVVCLKITQLGAYWDVRISSESCLFCQWWIQNPQDHVAVLRIIHLSSLCSFLFWWYCKLLRHSYDPFSEYLRTIPKYTEQTPKLAGETGVWGGLFWVVSLIYVLPQLLLYCIKYIDMVDRVVTAPDCI